MSEEKRVSGSLSNISVLTAFMLLVSCGGVPAIPDPPVPVIESDRSIDDTRESGIELIPPPKWLQITGVSGLPR